MKYLTAFVLALALGTAAPAAPTPQSFEEMLKLLNTQGMLDAIALKFDAQLEDMFDRALTNRETGQGVAYGAVFRLKVQRNFEKEISTGYLADTFFKEVDNDWTQEEVDALLALGKTPAGRSALAKLMPTTRALEKLAQQRFARFKGEPDQSLQVAMKELKEINTKALAEQNSAAATTPVGKVVEPAAGSPSSVPSGAESSKSK